MAYNPKVKTYGLYLYGAFVLVISIFLQVMVPFETIFQVSRAKYGAC